MTDHNSALIPPSLLNPENTMNPGDPDHGNAYLDKGKDTITYPGDPDHGNAYLDKGKDTITYPGDPDHGNAYLDRGRIQLHILVILIMEMHI